VTKKKKIDEDDNFEALRAEIEVAFDSGNTTKVIKLIKKNEYGNLVAHTTVEDDHLPPLFVPLRDSVASMDLKSNSWQKVARTLEEILEAIKDNWPSYILDKAVNAIGVTHIGKNEMPVAETLRDFIIHDATYKDSKSCKLKFDDIFRKYGMQTKKEVLEEWGGRRPQDATTRVR